MTLSAWFRRGGRPLVAAAVLVAFAGCDKTRVESHATAGAISGAVTEVAPPRALYVPDASLSVPAASLPTIAPAFVPKPINVGSRGCPPEMVSVRGRYCVDRFEATLVDAVTGNPLSPYYSPNASVTRREFRFWTDGRADLPTAEGRAMDIPAPPEWELAATAFEPKAVVSPGAIPNGYMSGVLAERACMNAGKRLCTSEEWVVACRGEQNRKFPYGDVYEDGRCNVCRATHPARVLHGNASLGHLDPRLNEVVEDEHGPLLREVGTTPSCKSDWDGDAIYDMVGNLDEWIDDPDGTFLGGFYSRATHEGCDSRIEVHSYDYFDYSLGVRCCKSL